MTTFYIDFENGNDANTGASFAQRWKTLTAGATAARVAPGDVIRVMATAYCTLVGDATWTDDSRTVTLAAAKTVTIDSCDVAWTGVTNSTVTAVSATCKEGTNSMQDVIAAGFTTGKAAFHATGTLDLSTMQQVCFWVKNSVAIAAATSFSLRLCTDTTGDVSVHTCAIPAIPTTAQWVPVVVDTGGALNAAIASVALYVDVDVGANTIQIDNVFAAKAPSAADSITLNSLIAKSSCLYWVTGTTYAVGDRRKPTPPNRTGFQYKVTAITTGVAGGAEPAWPTYWGGTVVDGGVTWTCERLEDTWHAIASIVGTTITLDGIHSTLPSATIPGKYRGDTETIATYKREPFLTPLTSSNTTNNVVQEAGSIDSEVLYTGGWNRTDMSTQDGESWFSGRNGTGFAVNCAFSYVQIENMNAVRYTNGIISSVSSNSPSGRTARVTNCHAVSCTTQGINFSGGTFNTTGKIFPKNIVAVGCTLGIQTETGYVDAQCLRAHGCTNGISIATQNTHARYRWTETYGNTVGCNSNGNSPVEDTNFRFLRSANVTGFGNLQGHGGIKLWNADQTGDTTRFNSTAINDGDVAIITSHNDGNVAGAMWIKYANGTIESDSANVHTAGKSWMWTALGTFGQRNRYMGPELLVGRIKLTAGVTKTVSIWGMRDETGGPKCKLICYGGQIAGIYDDVVSAELAPGSINTWTQSGSINLTSSVDGWVEVHCKFWDEFGSGTSHFWIDDLTVV